MNKVIVTTELGADKIYAALYQDPHVIGKISNIKQISTLPMDNRLSRVYMINLVRHMTEMSLSGSAKAVKAFVRREASALEDQRKRDSEVIMTLLEDRNLTIREVLDAAETELGLVQE